MISIFANKHVNSFSSTIKFTFLYFFCWHTLQTQAKFHPRQGLVKIAFGTCQAKIAEKMTKVWAYHFGAQISERLFEETLAIGNQNLYNGMNYVHFVINTFYFLCCDLLSYRFLLTIFYVLNYINSTFILISGILLRRRANARNVSIVRQCCKFFDSAFLNQVKIKIFTCCIQLCPN